MKNSKIFPTLLILIVTFLIITPFICAEQDGVIEFLYLSKEPGCASEYNGSFQAGDSIYVKSKFTNTGTEDLVNAKTFMIDSYDGNYGRYTSPSLYFNIKKDESILLCSALDTYTSYEPGKWTGRIYFRNNNNLDLSPVKYFYFDITSPTNDYQAVNVVTNLTSYTPVLPGEQKTFYIDVTNLNSVSNFIGTLRVSRLNFIDDGTTSKSIDIPGGQTERFLVKNIPVTEVGPHYTGIYVDASTGQDNKRSWPRLLVEGNYYRFIRRQLFTDQSVYAPGEKGKISLYVRNYGNTEWNSQSTYRFVIRGRATSSGTFQTVYDKTFHFPDSPAHQPGEEKWYYSTEFTNPISPLMADFIVYFYAYDPTGKQMVPSWQGYTSVYSLNSYPDISSSCTSDTYQTNTGINQKLTCDANGHTIVFVQEPAQGEIISIRAISGSLSTWWQGEKDGIPGYFIRGSADAVYELTFQITKILEMDALSFTPMLFLGFIFVFLVLFHFRRRK